MADRARRGRLRIIGGDWRGRRVSFPGMPGVRPSPDRLRETLFNWLTAQIAGARCLDLFAGSGALGLEALSRGAGEVLFVDRDRPVLQSIERHLDTLGAGGRGRTYHAEALTFLEAGDGVFDIIFLDPPFGHEILTPCLRALTGRLAQRHRIYMEYGRTQAPVWPDGTDVLKTARAGRVSAALLRMATD